MILISCDLTKINFKDLEIHGSDLSGSNLSDVNLTNMNLSKINLSGSNLKRTDFSAQTHQMRQQYPKITAAEQQHLQHGWMSQIGQHLNVGLNEIRLCVRILPMLGLLGTVDGMMACFEQLNNDDVLNAVSNGISQAMLTTLAGLLAAISGMYLAYNLKRQQQKLLDNCTKQWDTDEN